MAMPGLIASVDREAVPTDGIPFDTQRTTGEKVDCALCGRHRNHFKGFVVTFADGSKAIVGRNCGETQLFDKGAWAEMAARAERRKQSVLYEARSAPTIAAIDELIPVLRRCMTAVQPIDQLLSSVADELSDLFQGLSSAAKRDGELARNVAKKVSVVGKDGKLREVEDHRRKVFATIPTPLPFESKGLAAPLLKIKRGLETVRALLDQDGITLIQQSEAFRVLRTLGQDLREAQAEAEKARRFLSPDFWEAVAKWGRSDIFREGNYRVSGSVIRHSDKDHVFGEVRLPPAGSYRLDAFVQARAKWPRL